ncbi:hypothetical protein LCGC14_3012380, partial [marine sediment metagenome]
VEINVIKLARRDEKAISDIHKPLRIAVMGCIVNGPGESKHADVGISLPGTGEEPAAPADGRIVRKGGKYYMQGLNS